jgi:transposase
MSDRRQDGIASYCHQENKVSLGLVEGLNNKIFVCQPLAYGYRDEGYLKLKIIAALLPPLAGSAGKDPLRPAVSYFKQSDSSAGQEFCNE